MCGIVGYVGNRPVQDILLAGLERLEYRGYDSAGISIQADDRLDCVRAVGNLSHLKDALARQGDSGVLCLMPAQESHVNAWIYGSLRPESMCIDRPDRLSVQLGRDVGSRPDRGYTNLAAAAENDLLSLTRLLAYNCH